MNLRLIAVGTRMPRWVREGFDQYAKRFPRECRLELREIRPGSRSGTKDAIETEGKKILEAIRTTDYVIALEIGGESLSTQQLTNHLSRWLQQGRDIALLVGGPDGLSEACRARADLTWSLSRLTLPHTLVRIVVAEQLYRAWTVLQGHPYHRA